MRLLSEKAIGRQKAFSDFAPHVSLTTGISDRKYISGLAPSTARPQGLLWYDLKKQTSKQTDLMPDVLGPPSTAS